MIAFGSWEKQKDGMLHGPRIRSGVEVRCVSGKTFASDLQFQVELGLAGVNPSPFCKLRPALFYPRILAYNTSTATVLTFPSHAFLTQHVAVFLGSLFNSILCNCLNKSFFSQEFFVFFTREIVQLFHFHFSSKNTSLFFSGSLFNSILCICLNKECAAHLSLTFIG